MYAHEQGCPWDESTCKIGASGGHLECLKYAHGQGCLWDESICTEAARGGRFECLKYAGMSRVVLEISKLARTQLVGVI